VALTNSKLRVITENLVLGATLSVEPALNNVATMPIQNVQNRLRSLSFRSTAVDAAGITISFELTARKRVSAVVLDGNNLRVGDVFKVRLYSGPAKTGAMFETDWLEALAPKTLGDLNWGIDNMTASVFDDWDRTYSVAWFGSVAAQSGEILIISEDNPDGYIELNRLIIGQALSPERNFQYGYELDWTDTSTMDMTAGGSPRVEPGIVRRVIRLALPRIVDVERGTWADFIRSSTKYSEIFISLFPERGGKRERDYSMVCTVSARAPLRNKNARHYTLDVTLQEA